MCGAHCYVCRKAKSCLQERPTAGGAFSTALSAHVSVLEANLLGTTATFRYAPVLLRRKYVQSLRAHHVAADLDAKSEGVLRFQALRLHPSPVEVYQFCLFATGIGKAYQNACEYTTGRSNG